MRHCITSLHLFQVESSDAGVYVCTLKFEGEKSLSTKLNLTFEEERVSVIADSSGKQNYICLKGQSPIPVYHFLAGTKINNCHSSR